MVPGAGFQPGGGQFMHQMPPPGGWNGPSPGAQPGAQPGYPGYQSGPLPVYRGA
jgi:hypothetical protein